MSYMSRQISEELAMSHIGLKDLDNVLWNLPMSTLYEHALCNREAHLICSGALLVRHGHDQTVQDKYIVDDPLIDQASWQGEFHHSLSAPQFEALFNRMRAYLAGRALYVEDCLVAAQSGYDQSLRLITQDAWHCLFAKTMFASASDTDQAADQTLDSQEPSFTLIHAPHFHAVPSRDGVAGKAFVVLNTGLRIALIGGTAYAGEIKNTVFSMMAYLLEDSDVLPLHAAAYGAEDGSTTLLLGPEASGKTALVSDSGRRVLGDDAHGWSEQHIFNFEAGCYAQVNNLDKDNEPVIYAASQGFGTILENVGMNVQHRELHFDDLALSDNTRAAYPVRMIPEAAFPAMLSSPKHLVLLACDAFGVLPAISRLTADQMMYYYLLGYASHAPKNTVDGTELEAVFSPCCGMPLMVHHPSLYTKILGAKIRRGKIQCWLLNTGWSGGPAGVGERMSIGLTRTLLNAALNGNLDELDYQSHPVLGIQMPDQLDPMSTWHNQDDPNDYINAAKKLAEKFKTAFMPYADHMPAEVLKAGPR